VAAQHFFVKSFSKGQKSENDFLFRVAAENFYEIIFISKAETNFWVEKVSICDQSTGVDFTDSSRHRSFPGKFRRNLSK
jgi:hypothetical protein